MGNTMQYCATSKAMVGNLGYKFSGQCYTFADCVRRQCWSLVLQNQAEHRQLCNIFEFQGRTNTVCSESVYLVLIILGLFVSAAFGQKDIEFLDIRKSHR